MSLRKIYLGGAALLASTLFPVSASADINPFIGEVMDVGFNFCPRGWAQTDGQLLPISQYSALFSLLGTTYGGDGRTTFGLPDLRGRSTVDVGTGLGLSTYLWGQQTGAETVTINQVNMPTHTHRGGIRTGSATPNSTTPFQSYFTTVPGDIFVNGASITPGQNGQANRFMAEDTLYVEPTQIGDEAHENRPPYLAHYKCISLFGVYPSRN